MMKMHFLNVGQGDCSIIEHLSKRVSMIDCNLARKPIELAEMFRTDAGVRGNFGQGNEPVNPIEYMRARRIDDVFRFILTHADMDHMDGIKDVFDVFKPENFWDTKNNKVITQFAGTRYRSEDWRFYTDMRDGRIAPATRLVLNAGSVGQFYNRDGNNNAGGDGLYVLAPTPALTRSANSADDQNDGSYVILYRSPAGRILFGGDSHDATWEYILANHADDVRNVDLLIAPHHGRGSDRDFDFLSIVRPKVTLFGVASSEHLAYSAWRNRGLPYFTQNQGGSFIVDTSASVIPTLRVFCTNASFAQRWTQEHGATTAFDQDFQAYGLCHIKPASAARAA